MEKGFKRYRRLIKRDRIILLLGIFVITILFTFTFWKAFPVLQIMFGGSIVYAADSQYPVFDYKSIINFLMMIFVVCAAGVTTWVIFFSDNLDKVQMANDYFKMIFGFILGCGKSFLGV